MPTINLIDPTGSFVSDDTFFIPDRQFALLFPSEQDRARRGLFSLLEAQRAAQVGPPIDITSFPELADQVASGVALTPAQIASVNPNDPRGQSAPAPTPVEVRTMLPTVGSTVVPFTGGQQSLSIGGIIRTIGGFIPEPIPGIVNKLFPAGCPSGFKKDSKGNCIKTGVGGVIQRTLPGGKKGTLEDVFGDAVIGAFGVPGLVPAQVGVINDNPILKCPAGMVLGKDNICYVRSVLPRQFRKWPPPGRAPVTAGDAKAIRRAKSATNRVKKLASNVGFTCTKKGSFRGGSHSHLVKSVKR